MEFFIQYITCSLLSVILVNGFSYYQDDTYGVIEMVRCGCDHMHYCICVIIYYYLLSIFSSAFQKHVLAKKDADLGSFQYAAPYFGPKLPKGSHAFKVSSKVVFCDVDLLYNGNDKISLCVNYLKSTYNLHCLTTVLVDPFFHTRTISFY